MLRIVQHRVIVKDRYSLADAVTDLVGEKKELEYITLRYSGSNWVRGRECSVGSITERVIRQNIPNDVTRLSCKTSLSSLYNKPLCQTLAKSFATLKKAT